MSEPVEVDRGKVLSEFRSYLSALRKQYTDVPSFVDGARLCEQLQLKFDDAVRAEHDALLSLEEAAAASGYDPRHLRRLASGPSPRVPCSREGRRLVFRKADLPRKPTKPERVDAPDPDAYDADADARRVRAGRHRGGSRP